MTEAPRDLDAPLGSAHIHEGESPSCCWVSRGKHIARLPRERRGDPADLRQPSNTSLLPSHRQILLSL